MTYTELNKGNLEQFKEDLIKNGTLMQTDWYSDGTNDFRFQLKGTDIWFTFKDDIPEETHEIFNENGYDWSENTEIVARQIRNASLENFTILNVPNKR